MSEHIIWNEIGNLHCNADSYEQAIKAYNRAIDLDSSFGQAVQNLARVYASIGDYEEAIPLYQQSLEVLSNSTDKAVSWNDLGKAYQQRKKYDKAQIAFQRAVELDPDNPLYEENLNALHQDLDQSPEQPDEEQPQPVERSPKSADIEGHITHNPAEANTGAVHEEPLPVLIEPEQPQSILADEEPQRHSELETAAVIEAPVQPESPSVFIEVCIEQIYPNPRQPRQHLHVADLLDSIREHGVIQPLLVTPGMHPDSFMLISGERRLEAARQVGLDCVPVIVRQAGEQEQLELLLIENVQRLNLSPIEQAEAYAQLNEEFGLSHEQIAVRVGKSRVSVTNTMRLLKLPEKLKKALTAGRITEGHARALLALPSVEMQVAVLQEITEADLSVRKTEMLVRERVMRNNEAQMSAEPEPVLSPVIETLADDEMDPVIEAENLPETVLAEDAPFAEPVIEAVSNTEETSLSETVDQAALDDENSGDSEGQDEQESSEWVWFETGTPEPLSETRVVDRSLSSGAAAVAEQQADTLVEVETRSVIVAEEDPAAEVYPWVETPAGPQESASGEALLAEPSVMVRPEPSQKISLERVRGSIVTYKAVTEANPRNDKAWDTLGNLYMTVGDFEAAIHAFEQAVLLGPDNEAYHYNLGQAYLVERRYEEASQDFQAVVRLNPENVYAHCALASCYRHLGDEAQAQVHLEIAEPQMPFEKEYNRACFQAIRGDAEEAINLLNIALELEQTTLHQIQQDPDLDFIRHEPRFVALVENGAYVS